MAKQPEPVTKDSIRTMVKRFVNHREKMYQNFGAKATQRHWTAITRIKAQLSYYQNNNIMAHYRMILALKDDLIIILPGSTSTYYECWKNRMDDLIQCCENKIKEIEGLQHG